MFAWEEFRQALIREVAAAEARGGEFRYYDAWLAAFEGVLAGRGVLAPTRSRRSPSSSSSASATTSSSRRDIAGRDRSARMVASR